MMVLEIAGRSPAAMTVMMTTIALFLHLFPWPGQDRRRWRSALLEKNFIREFTFAVEGSAFELFESIDKRD